MNALTRSGYEDDFDGVLMPKIGPWLIPPFRYREFSAWKPGWSMRISLVKSLRTLL